jgi:biopolymer transport protein ExbB/TolQ
MGNLLDQVGKVLYGLDWFTVFTRTCIGILTAGMVVALRWLWKILKHVAGAGDRQKALEAKLENSDKEIVKLYNDKDEARHIINRQHENLLVLASRLDKIEEKSEAQEAEITQLRRENTKLKQRIAKLENILTSHNIKEE